MKNSNNTVTIGLIALFLAALCIFVVTSKKISVVKKPLQTVSNSFEELVQKVSPETKSMLQMTEDGTLASTTQATTTEEVVTTPKKVSRSTGTYLEVLDGCGPYFGGQCLSVRNGPGTSYDKLYKLRSGIVLKVVGSETTIETPKITKMVPVIDPATGTSTGSTTIQVTEGEPKTTTWYKIGFDEWIRYPERLNTKNWYVSSDYVRLVKADRELASGAGVMPETDKKIIVDRGDQMLYAYEGKELFMKQAVSTGKQGTLTPRGTFHIFSKVPSRYMQGPLPGISDQQYDLPGVPWTMYFTEQGAALHGAYWHDKFGQEWSHGCVNLPTDKAEKLYKWADIGTTVVVRD